MGDVPDPSKGDPTGSVHIDEVIRVMQQYLDQRSTDRLTLNQRMDFLVSELGGIRELVHRVDLYEERLGKVEIVGQTLIAILKDAQEDFDVRAQVVLKDAEMLRNTVRDATVAWQSAQEAQNSDWDDKWNALRLSLEALNEKLKARETSEATIVVSKIGRSERIWITVITVLGGALMALISSFLLNAAQAVK